jgi:hypothetical protein
MTATHAGNPRPVGARSAIGPLAAPAMSVVEPLTAKELITPSWQSLRALSWLNFFLSGMQTAFGPIAAAYLGSRVDRQGHRVRAQHWRHCQSRQSDSRRRGPRCCAGETAAGRDLRGHRCLEYVDFPPLAHLPVCRLRGNVARDHRRHPWTGCYRYYARTGWSCRVGGTTWIEPALRGRRRRRGDSHDGRRRVCRVALGNVGSGRSRRSGARRIELDSG